MDHLFDEENTCEVVGSCSTKSLVHISELGHGKGVRKPIDQTCGLNTPVEMLSFSSRNWVSFDLEGPQINQLPSNQVISSSSRSFEESAAILEYPFGRRSEPHISGKSCNPIVWTPRRNKGWWWQETWHDHWRKQLLYLLMVLTFLKWGWGVVFFLFVALFFRWPARALLWGQNTEKEFIEMVPKWGHGARTRIGVMP